MAKSGKRSAEEAFEEVQLPEVGAEKKKRKRNKNKNKNKVHKKSKEEAMEAKNELEHTTKVIQVGENDQEGLSTHEEPAVEQESASHGGKSKKKRKREWRERLTQTTPKKEDKDSREPLTGPEREESTAGTPEQSESKRKRKRRRQQKNKHGKTEEARYMPAAHDVGDEASEDKGARLQADTKVGGTMGDHRVESVKDVRRRKKKEARRVARQLQSQLEVGNGDSVRVENDLKATQAAEKEKPAEPLPHEPAGATEPANGDAQTPKKSKKRKRTHPGRHTPLTKRDDIEIEEQEDATAMEVDEESPEVTSAPLEDRIEVPDEMKCRQEDTEVDGDALSANVAGEEAAFEVCNNETLTVAALEEKQKHKNQSHQTDHRGGQQYRQLWSVSDGTGGIFIDQDPILTPDDQYLILPTRSEVRIYHRSTSNLVRSLPCEGRDHIVSCVLLDSDPSLLLVGTSKGIVLCYDWTDGNLLDVWSTAGGLKQIIPLATDGRLSILAMHQNDKRFTLKAFDLGTGTDEATEVATLQDRTHLGSVQYYPVAGVVVTSARRRILIGHCRKLDLAELGGDSFTWHELELASVVASFGVQAHPPVGNRRLPRIDLAAGLASGDILAYEDVLFKIIGKEKNPKSEGIEPRTLSWHRNLVNTVKWSRDGNYIISGGSETTLISWQLDTNQQQPLPNLASRILNLSVSSKGSAYALRLADNSVMVLGTLNLTPETNVSGFAAPLAGRHIACLHPSSPERLLIACPADSLLPLKHEDHNTSLQTFDLVADEQLGRQALTRNLTTVVNVDPEGHPLHEPNVSHLQISADGRWLATIDEWQPPQYDLNPTHLPEETAARRQSSEIRLRIWSHDENQAGWELVTRVDDPNSVASILSLQSNPAKAEFAAVGADGIIRVWQPKARVRDGVRVQDDHGKQLFTWLSTNAVNVPMHGKDKAKSAALAYSDDGSILAVSLELDEKELQWTHLIDARSGELVHSVPDLVTSGERCIVFAGRSLVLLSNTICVYDIINAQVLSRTDLAKEYTDRASSRFMAVNKLNNTIAVGLNRSGKHGSRLTVLDVNDLDDRALFQGRIQGQIRALLASASATGFVVIDGHNQIRKVKPPGRATALIPTAAAAETEEVARGLDRVFGKGQAVNGEVNGAGTASRTKMLTNGGQENDQAAGRTLEEALGFDTTASVPGVDDLFERIVRVFAKPAVEA